MVAMTDPAKKGPQAVVWLPMKSASPICTVNFDGSLSIVSATGNSSKAALKVNMDTSATAGSDSGMIRRPITRIVLAPSSRNASSYSRDTGEKTTQEKDHKRQVRAHVQQHKPFERVDQMEPVHEQVLRDQEQYVRYRQAGEEDIEDQLSQWELIAREGERSQRGQDDCDNNGGEGDPEAVEEVMPEAVFRPGLGVVARRGMVRDEHCVTEDVVVVLERERDHVEEGPRDIKARSTARTRRSLFLGRVPKSPGWAVARRPPRANTGAAGFFFSVVSAIGAPQISCWRSTLISAQLKPKRITASSDASAAAYPNSKKEKAFWYM